MLAFAPDEPATSSADRMMRANLRDMEEHLSQYRPQVVESDDGRLLIAASAMVDGQIDIEPYPHNTPRLRLPVPEDNALDAANGAALRRIELTMDDYGIQNIGDPETGAQVLARANPSGFKGHGFVVEWLGSRRQWLVLPGSINWREYDDITGIEEPKSHQFDRTILSMIIGSTSGWIVLAVKVQPLPFDSRHAHITGANGYTISPEGVILVTRPENQPPINTRNSGEISPGIYWDVSVWTSGTFFLPIAYVEEPDLTRRSPYIAQMAGGSFLVDFINPLAAWVGTFPLLSFR